MENRILIVFGCEVFQMPDAVGAPHFAVGGSRQFVFKTKRTAKSVT
jgi:hypothetical protein